MLKACACAGEQGSRGAGEQRRVQCAKFNPLRPSAPLHFKLVRNAGLTSQSHTTDVHPPPNLTQSCHWFRYKAPHQLSQQPRLPWRLAVGKTCQRMKTQASRMRSRGAQTLRAYRTRQLLNYISTREYVGQL
ncbi:MAG: hypothetical protein V7K72_26885 [Nostoc sp.]|uniref:hypothetical protein n=1 Tax=Nostoc sp. TaxID=1180 RepID=UPI002FF4596D